MAVTSRERLLVLGPKFADHILLEDAEYVEGKGYYLEPNTKYVFTHEKDRKGEICSAGRTCNIYDAPGWYQKDPYSFVLDFRCDHSSDCLWCEEAPCQCSSGPFIPECRCKNQA